MLDKENKFIKIKVFRSNKFFTSRAVIDFVRTTLEPKDTDRKLF